MGKDLKVIYMFNGLIYIVEKVESNQNLEVKSVLALAPGNEEGNIRLMEAFPFTDINEVITFQPGSYVAITEIGDPRLVHAYENGIKQIRSQQSGLILP